MLFFEAKLWFAVFHELELMKKKEKGKKKQQRKDIIFQHHT